MLYIICIISSRGDIMDENNIEFAVKFYQNQKKQGGCTYEEFKGAIVEHIKRRPLNKTLYDPFCLESSVWKLWCVLEMSMKDIVEGTGWSIAKFSRRFCIPYRTLQAWCNGTNECPIYIKLMICEILKLYSRSFTVEGYHSIFENTIG